VGGLLNGRAEATRCRSGFVVGGDSTVCISTGWVGWFAWSVLTVISTLILFAVAWVLFKRIRQRRYSDAMPRAVGQVSAESGRLSQQ
jgi:hypothetical protein